MLTNYIISVPNSSICGKYFHANFGKLFIYSFNFPFAEINFTFKTKTLENSINSVALYICRPDFGNASTLKFLEILKIKKKTDFEIYFC